MRVDSAERNADARVDSRTAETAVMVAELNEGASGNAAARVLAAADQERRRLERDLHDGAQQRLVSLALHLRLLRRRLVPGSEAERLLAIAQDELTASLQELRELARGLHPAALSEHGLRGALESLALRAPLPVELSVHSTTARRRPSRSPRTTSFARRSPTSRSTQTPTPRPSGPPAKRRARRRGHRRRRGRRRTIRRLGPARARRPR